VVVANKFRAFFETFIYVQICTRTLFYYLLYTDMHEIFLYICYQIKNIHKCDFNCAFF